MFKAIFPALGAPALMLSLALPVAAQDASTPVVTVGGTPITLGEVLVIADGMGGMGSGMDDAELWDMIIDQLTRQEALAQKSAGQQTARDAATLVLQRRAYLASAALERVAAPEPDDEALAAAYAEYFGEVEPVQEYHAAHILVETEEAAQSAAEALAAGEDFAKVAEERSLDTSGPGGGDLGWFTIDMMVPTFGEAVAAMAPGDVSEPVQTQFGWHIVKLFETRMQEPPALDEVRDQLAMLIRRERVEAAADDALTGVEVTRNPDLGADLLSRRDLLED